MICKNCGFEMADSASFCSACGSRLVNDENCSSGFNSGYSYGNGEYRSNENQSYDRNYGQNFGYGYGPNYGAPIDLSGLKKGSIIAVGIIALLTGNILPLILAVIAFVYCNDYESAVRTGNYDLADRKFLSIRRLRKWAWGLEIAYAVFCILLVFIAVFILGRTEFIPYSYAYGVNGKYLGTAFIF